MPPTDRQLDKFLTQLSRLKLPNTTNPFDHTREGRRRIGNLRGYLQHFRPPHSCDILLVAEAYGYRGGRVTGVPLSSESVIAEHPHFRKCFPTLADNYQPCRERGALSTEATASIVWKLFDEMDVRPCCWNIVPVHPYDPARGQWSNRPPTKGEIDAGVPFAVKIIELLHPTKVIAVGKCAARGLTQAGIDHAVVRHPSQGGANIFRVQMHARLTEPAYFGPT